jgi:hypothetical protein
VEPQEPFAQRVKERRGKARGGKEKAEGET